MSAAAAWLEPRITDAPDSLRERMVSAVTATAAQAGVPDTLANAAFGCLRQALRNPAQRASALDLLAADALLTHACEAAAEQGTEALLAFTGRWNTTRLQELLSQP